MRVADNLPRFKANNTWATQGVYNLLINALKFVRPNEPPNIEIAPYHSNGTENAEVRLIVRDCGPGVAPEHAERIFQLFQRAVGQGVEGTGAGLAIVRQVAEHMADALGSNRVREAVPSSFLHLQRPNLTLMKRQRSETLLAPSD